jgi:cyclopropane-fatty-acyl-phospholipid synthase
MQQASRRSRGSEAGRSAGPVRGGVLDHAALLGLRAIRRGLGSPPLRLELAGGPAVGPPAAEAIGTVRIADRTALLQLLLDAELAFGDLYTQERIELEGDVVEMLTAANRQSSSPGLRARLPRWLRDPRLHQELGRAADNARRHYDVGNEFYSLWLDAGMVYTCAYFPTPEVSLEEAQLAKMDHVCRKLRLRPGEEVIEAGCGWGSLALHMARWYGVRVRAFNVSHEQVLWAREQAEKQGLADRVEFVEDDYRNIDGRCDAFVSVGMLEHVGPDHYEALGALIDRVLAPEGRGLIHTIGRSRAQRLNRWVVKRIFPNAHPPTISEMMRIFEPRDFAVLDLENLRRHYELTALHWLRRYEANRRAVDGLVPRETARAWHLYLAGTVSAFRAATMCLYQVVFSRAANDAIPWTRADLYRAA